jgi:hypothetical protein
MVGEIVNQLVRQAHLDLPHTEQVVVSQVHDNID